MVSTLIRLWPEVFSILKAEVLSVLSLNVAEPSAPATLVIEKVSTPLFWTANLPVAPVATFTRKFGSVVVLARVTLRVSGVGGGYGVAGS